MLSGIITIALMLIFVAIWVWAWRPQNKQAFEETARLALDDGEAARDNTPDRPGNAGKASGQGERHA